MKREEVQQHIPGITKDQLDWLMNENGNDVTREKNAAKKAQEQLEQAQAQLKTAQDGLKAFEGVDVDGLKDQVAALQSKLDAQADAYAFDAALDSAIRDAKGRSVKAIRGMLDVEALKASKDRSADIKAAVESLAKENAWAFDRADAPAAGTGVTVSTGAEHGTGGTTGSGVEDAFYLLNPTLK